MSNAIVCCDCPGVLPRARAAHTIHIKKPVPHIYEGKSSICSLADSLPSGSPIEQHIRALSKNKEKFAYYFEWNDAAIETKFNLLTGRKVS